METFAGYYSRGKRDFGGSWVRRGNIPSHNQSSQSAWTQLHICAAVIFSLKSQQHPLIPIHVIVLKLRPISALIIDGHQRIVTKLYEL